MNDENIVAEEEEDERKPGLGWQVFDSLFFLAIGVLLFLFGLVAVYVLWGVLNGDTSYNVGATFVYGVTYTIVGYLVYLLIYMVYHLIGTIAQRRPPHPNWIRSGVHKMLVAMPIGVGLLIGFVGLISFLQS